MVCTRTLCNELWTGSLSPSAAEVPEALKRKHADLGRRISLQKNALLLSCEIQECACQAVEDML